MDACVRDRPKSMHTKCKLICRITARTKHNFRSRVWWLWNYLTNLVKKLMATKAASSTQFPSSSTLGGTTVSDVFANPLVFRHNSRVDLNTKCTGVEVGSTKGLEEQDRRDQGTTASWSAPRTTTSRIAPCRGTKADFPRPQRTS